MQKSYIINSNALSKELDEYSEYSDTKLSYTKKNDVLSEIQTYIDNNDEINANFIMKLMFPKDRPHLFLSHKSQNASQAIRLANILYNKYEITSFIDSQVWQHIDIVSDMINYKTSLINDKNGRKTYSHRSANIVSSNLFSMLSVSLLETMDISDGYIYIDSNQDEKDNLSIDNIKELQTKSPWLFLEAKYASNIRIRSHPRPIPTYDSKPTNESRQQAKIEKSPSFSYKMCIGEATTLNSLCNIFDYNWKASSPLEYLDWMYNLFDSSANRR